ncbi:MAG: hypothetical protein LHW57_07170 [Candidatus Cloacimonetes bacterium]|nr:hypothetical protein [Candidatus Cloacimonadota bacterium]
MPGINLFIDPDGVPKEQIRRCAELANKLCGALPALESRTAQPAPESLVVLCEHPAYLVSESRQGGWQVFLEGVSGLPEGFSRLLQELAAPEPASLDLAKLWNRYLDGVAGSFFFLAVNPERRLVAFANDALARLPVYLYHKQGRLILGRDFGLVKGAAGMISPDPLYLALSLMLAYVPGRGTPFPEIDTLRGGTLAVYDWAQDRLSLADQPELRFPAEDHSGSPKSRLPELVELFHATVRASQGELPTLLSLSGGYDSRCVAASLLHQNIPFEACTFLDADRTTADEVAVARELASLGAFPLRVPELAETGEEEHKTLFSLKGGLNYLAASFLVQFLKRAGSSHPGGFLLLTGDGGQVMKGLHTDREISSLEHCLELLYAREAIFDPQACARLFGIAKDDLDAYLLDLFAAYPQDSYTEKYTSFILCERGARWLFEGEDRNRCFCRCEAPLYDYRFYRLARRIPNSWKRDYAFYSSFLHALSPELSRVRYANRKWSPNQMRNPLYRLLVTRTRKLRKPAGGTNTGSNVFSGQKWLSERILSQLSCEQLQTALPGSRRISDPKYLQSLNRTQLGNLYTITSILAGSA